MRNHILPLAVLALLGACADDPTAARPGTPEPAPAPKLVGMVEITLRGVGTPNLSATIAPAAGPRLALSSVPGGTIQLRRLSASAVDVGTRGAGGERYVQAVFEVRNADLAGTPYTTPRQNLTFVPVASSATLPGTPVRSFLKQDGTAADPALAQQLRPTGAVAADGAGGVVPQYADVLQALTEAEAQSLSLVAGATPFPYGFVTRYATQTGTRELPASPAAEQYDGRVTFAFRLPLAATADQDAYTISITAAAMDDSETRVTQSLEEQTAAGQAAFEARAAALGATRVVLLPGGSYGGPIAQQTICGVRTAGTPQAPTAFLGGAPGAFQSFMPNPYGSTLLGRTAPILVTTSGCAAGASASSFRVHAFQSSPRYLQGAYTLNGSAVQYSHASPFSAGEAVEVTLTAGLTTTPRVARFRVASAPATATFTSAGSFTGAAELIALAAADVNGDGRQDLVAGGRYENAVLLGNGAGGFTAVGSTGFGLGGKDIALGDVTGDGNLDLVATSYGDARVYGEVSVYRGDGAGGFAAAGQYVRVERTVSVALTDLNTDGHLDIVGAVDETSTLASYSSTYTNPSSVVVLLNDGTGGFTTSRVSTGGQAIRELDVGDVNADGRMDVVVTLGGFTQSRILPAEIRVLLGDGAGGLGAATSYPLVRVTSSLPLGQGDGGALTELRDVDGDGDLDVVTLTADLSFFGYPQTSYVTVLRGDGAGAFGPLEETPLGYAAQILRASDLDGDGDVDLGVPTSFPFQVNVLLGNGSGAFAAGTPIAGPEYLVNAIFADLNGDGKTDAALTPQQSRSVSVRLNQ